MQARLTANGFEVIDGSIDPRRGYEYCDSIQVSGITYTGYQHASGRWIIAKLNEVDITDTSARYCAGIENYSTAWAAAQSLGYDYPAVAFRSL